MCAICYNSYIFLVISFVVSIISAPVSLNAISLAISFSSLIVEYVSKGEPGMSKRIHTAGKWLCGIDATMILTFGFRMND